MRGSKLKQASPQTSGSDVLLEHKTGVPQDIASSGGKPKPSSKLGKTKAKAELLLHSGGLAEQMKQKLGVNEAFMSGELTRQAAGGSGAYVKQAILANYKGLGFSDHVMLPNIENGVIRGDFNQKDDYINSIRSLQKQYEGIIEIYLGFECEYSKQYVKYYKELLDSKAINDNEATKLLTFTHFSNPLFIFCIFSFYHKARTKFIICIFLKQLYPML